jgi:outer membrane murein-binding lipoprotein Lpp
MLEHLTAQQIERYNKRAMLPAELLTVDTHLAGCRSCRRRLSEVEELQTLFMSLRSDLQSAINEPEHPVCEDLLAYAEGGLDEVDREIVESHLEFCLQCMMELRDLREFREAAVVPAYVQRKPEPVARPSFWERFVAFWSAPAHWIPLQVAATALVAGLFVWIATLPLRTQVSNLEGQLATLKQENERLQQDYKAAKANAEELQNQIAQLQQSSGASIKFVLNDGGSSVALDSRGNLTGLESLPASYQQIVKNTLSSEKVQTPPQITELIGKSGSLMGTGSLSFAVLSPVGTVVQADRPAFRWNPLNGATGYYVTVYDPDLNRMAKSELLSVTSWTAPESLKRGGTYSWQVIALKDGKEILSPAPPAPEAKFKVLEQAKSVELERAKKTYSGSHLVLGTLYSQAGLLDEAEREFQALLDANPNSQIAQKLLGSVKSKRGKK